MPFTVLICASCEVICELSIGLSGSWFFNCATSSFMNVFCRSLPLVMASWLPEVVLEVLVVLPVELTVMFVSRWECAVYWPRVRALEAIVLVVLATSTLAWYERDAEIMLTISSTTSTFGMVT